MADAQSAKTKETGTGLVGLTTDKIEGPADIVINLSSDVKVTENTKANAEILARVVQANSDIQTFTGKGSLADYEKLFEQVKLVSVENVTAELNVQLDGLEALGVAAEGLSAMFAGVTATLASVRTIDDSNVLKSAAVSLDKIVKLSKVFGEFQETITATSAVEIPKSVQTTGVILAEVSKKVDVAMTYIDYFVNPSEKILEGAALNDAQKADIAGATNAIVNWNSLCKDGVSFAMTTNADIQNLRTTDETLMLQAKQLQQAVSSLTKSLTDKRLSDAQTNAGGLKDKRAEMKLTHAGDLYRLPF